MTPLLAPRPRPDRAFERLYRRHVDDVYRYALAMLRNSADAEDVTQTTFLNAYRAFERGERPRAPQNWLITIAHNVCRQRFRQTQRRVQEVTFNENLADEFVSDDDAPTIQDVQRALGHLAFNQRSALVMRELEGRSYVEIAQALEVSTSAVETLLFRARRALREQLEGGLTCGEAELSISLQLDGRLARSNRGPLRAHLRECKDCASLARRQRGQRAAIKALGAVPLPTSLSSLSSLFGGGAAGGAAAVGGGVAAKAVAVAAAGLLVAGVGYESVQRVTREPAQARTETTVAPVSQVSGQARLAALAQAAASGAGRQSEPAKRTEHAAGQKAESKKLAKVEAAGRAKARGKSAARARIKPAARSKSAGRPDGPGRSKPGAGKPGATGASQEAERGGTPQITPRQGHNGQRTEKTKPNRPAKKGTPVSHPSKGSGHGGSEDSKEKQDGKKDKGEAGKFPGGHAGATKKLEPDDGLAAPEDARKEEKDPKSPPGQEDKKGEPKDGTAGSTTTPTAPHQPPGHSDDHGKDKGKK